MSNIQKIKIEKIGRKQQPSKFKEGETYSIATIQDGITGKKMSAFGAWTDSWKVGDEIEGVVESKTWKDKDGFDQVSLNITNPNKKTFTPYAKGGASKPLIVEAFHIAAALAPILYAGSKKKLKLTDITELAEAIKKELEKGNPAPVEESKTVETTNNDTKEDDVETIDVSEDVEIEDVDEEDDKPF